MKKKILLILALFLLLMPFVTFAKEENIKDGYPKMNLEETLADEAIEPAFSEYTETDDQITIYLFRGKGCDYCKAFLEYLNSITEEYGKYFKLESYEVWLNTKNAKLMNNVVEFLEEQSGGVPFIIIGDQVFPGYADVYNESIVNAIMNLYESEERYDVFEEMQKAAREEAWQEVKPFVITTIVNVCFITTCTVLTIVFNHKNNKKLIKRLDDFEKGINSSSK